jgi:hypothetical protein
LQSRWGTRTLPPRQPCRRKAGCALASLPGLTPAMLRGAAQTTSAAAPTARPTCSMQTCSSNIVVDVT